MVARFGCGIFLDGERGAYAGPLHLWVPAYAGMTGEGERRQITFCPTLELHHRRVRKLSHPALPTKTRILRHVAILCQPVLRSGLDRGHAEASVVDKIFSGKVVILAIE